MYNSIALKILFLKSALKLKVEQINTYRDVAQFGDVSERRRWRIQRGIRSGAITSIAK